MKKIIIYACSFMGACFLSLLINAQYVTTHGNDATTPLHLLKPHYEIPYGETTLESVKQKLETVFQYLNTVTPTALVNKNTDEPIAIKNADSTSILQKGDYRLTSYEWGVTYSGMLEAATALSDSKYSKYTIDRVNFLGEVVQHFRAYLQKNAKASNPVRSIMNPHALDDAGALAASMIKALNAGADMGKVKPMVDNFIQYIMNKEFRLTDGTFARNRPLPNSLWLDDLYMSLPALVQMGKLTGDTKYFDEVISQYQKFTSRMFNSQKNIFMHGWVQNMEPHPQFHWARANGWALMTAVEILDVLPNNYPGRSFILDIYKKHVAGLATLQDKTGFWHQLLNKNDSYLETSATAIYTYCIARGINKGWLDAKAYGPLTLLAWNAVATKINDKGQVEGTCVGTGMGFDPAFYYYRPISNYAAHGYGPVLLAGAEIYKLLKTHPFKLNDSAVQF
ncbi:MAG: glycoside hydrolase family 105 protein [Niabella sp.]